MIKRVVLLGGGGHCKAVIDVIRAEGKYNIACVLDRTELIGKNVIGIPYSGTDDEIAKLAGNDAVFIITVGHLGRPRIRRRLSRRVFEGGGELVKSVSPRAYVSPEAVIGAGTVIFHGAVVNASARVGKNCILNTNSIVEHDSVIEDEVHVSTGAIVNGSCRVGTGTFVGSGAVVIHGVSVAKENVIAAGAVVHRNTEAHAVYAGVPAISKRFSNE